MKTTLFLLLFLLLSCQIALFAQQDSTIHSLKWELTREGSIGPFSYSGNSSFSGFLVGLDFIWKRATTYYKLRANYGAEMQLMSVKNPNENMVDIGFLWGKIYTYQKFQFSAFAGGGILAGTLRGEFISRGEGWFAPSYYQNKGFFRPAIPLQTGILLLPSRKFGIGIDLMGSITPKESFSALVLKLTFGDLR